MATPEPFFNESVYGNGMEGFINYANLLVDGVLATFFMIALFIVMFGILYRSKFRVGVCIMYTSFMCFILTMTLKLFTTVNELLIIAFGVGIGIGVIISYMEKK